MGNGATPESLPRLPSTLLKTKERCEKSWNEAGTLLIAKEIRPESGNVTENKGESINFAKSLALGELQDTRGVPKVTEEMAGDRHQIRAPAFRHPADIEGPGFAIPAAQEVWCLARPE
jgi:hypothetical protein